MKRFIRTLFLFSILFLLAAKFAHLIDRDAYSGSPYYSKKYKFYEEHKLQFNSVIFGSSRMFRQVNPAIIDSMLKEYHFSTFNMGAPATFNPEEYYLYEKLLEDHPNFKYAFIEFQPLCEIAENNVDSKRSYYWMNLKYLNFSIHYVLDANYPQALKTKIIREYCQGYINNMFDFSGCLAPFHHTNAESDNCLGKNKNGFYSLNEEMEDTPGDNEFRYRLTSFLKDTTILKERINMSKVAFSEKNTGVYLNKYHLNYLKRMIEKSEAKGIQLFFIIPPRLTLKDYQELLSLAKALPEKNVIQLADVNKYPEFYKSATAFDIGHLNKTGAELFSRLLAAEIEKRIVIAH
ncbi:MAG: hypothetical protein ACXVPY_09655 [Bacteroidia bacterium]